MFFIIFISHSKLSVLNVLGLILELIRSKVNDDLCHMTHASLTHRYLQHFKFIPGSVGDLWENMTCRYFLAGNLCIPAIICICGMPYIESMETQWNGLRQRFIRGPFHLLSLFYVFITFSIILIISQLCAIYSMTPP